jgi:amphi-Trp domain-containing protein
MRALYIRAAKRVYAPLMKKKARDLERTYSRRQFVEKLRRLADALEEGKGFVIQVAGERLRIPASVTFNIEHEREDGVNELEFQLIWSEEA